MDLPRPYPAGATVFSRSASGSASLMPAAVETHTFEDDGGIPNSPLPVLIHHGVESARDAAACDALFAGNGWLGAWRDGIFSFHHFHSTAHEVLGIVVGSAAVLLGGPGGRRFDVVAGDVLVLPAGTGHCSAGSSDDLLVIGAYPDGMAWDIRRGNPAEHDEVLANIRAVPLPHADPGARPRGPARRALGCRGERGRMKAIVHSQAAAAT